MRRWSVAAGALVVGAVGSLAAPAQADSAIVFPSEVATSITADAAGGVLLTGTDTSTDEVFARTRAPGGGWSGPTDLGPATAARQVAGASGRAGEAIVAWVADGSVDVRVLSPGGAWGPVQVLATGTATNVQVAMNHDGDAAVSWNQARPSGSPVDVVAVRERGAPRWYTRTTNADRFTVTRLGIDGRGIVQHAWYARPDGHYGKLFLRTKRPGRVWSAGRQLTPDDENQNQYYDLDVDTAGRITYLTDPLSGKPARLFHQTTPGGAFHLLWSHAYDGAGDLAVAGRRVQLTWWDNVSDSRRTLLRTKSFTPAPGPTRLVGTGLAFHSTALAADGTGIVVWDDVRADGRSGWSPFTAGGVGPQGSTTTDSLGLSDPRFLLAKGKGVDFVVGFRDDSQGRATTVVHLVH